MTLMEFFENKVDVATVGSTSGAISALSDWLDGLLVIERWNHKLPVFVLAGAAGVGKSYVAGQLVDTFLATDGGERAVRDLSLESVQGLASQPFYRFLHLRWQDFQEIPPRAAGLDLEQLAKHIPSWAQRIEYGGLSSEIVGHFYKLWLETMALRFLETPGEPRHLCLVLVVHDVEEAFAAGVASDNWDRTIKELGDLAGRTVDTFVNDEHIQIMVNIGVVLTTRVTLWKDDDADVTELEVAEPCPESYHAAIEEMFGLNPLLESLVKDDVSKPTLFLLCGCTKTEAQVLLNNSRLNKLIRRVRFDDVRERARIPDKQCLGHVCDGAGFATSNSYFYSPLRMELACILRGQQIPTMPDLLRLSLRDGVDDDDLMSQTYLLALERVYNCIGAAKCEDRKEAELIFKTLLLVMMIAGTRSRSSGWLLSDLEGLVKDSCGEVLFKIALPPVGNLGQRARRRKKTSDSASDWATVLVLDHLNRVTDPYRSFFEPDILHSKHTIVEKLNAAKGSMWLPRHPTVRDFGVKLNLLCRVCQVQQVHQDLPDSSFWSYLYEQWVRIRERVLESWSLQPGSDEFGLGAQDNQEPDRHKFEKFGIRASLGGPVEPRKLVDALDTHWAGMFPHALTNFFSSMLGLYEPSFGEKPQEYATRFGYDEPWIERDDGSVDPDLTLMLATFAERAYQDLDLWAQAQAMTEALRALEPGNLTDDPRIMRHQQFGLILDALLQGENDGDYLGTVESLREVALSHPSVDIPKSTSRAIALTSLGAFSKAAQSWETVVTKCDAIKDKDRDLSALTERDRQWIGYEKRCAQVNLAAVSYRRSPGDDALQSLACLVDNLQEEGKGRIGRGDVYALGQIAYVCAQARAPKSCHLLIKHLDETVRKALSSAKHISRQFDGDAWIHYVLEGLEAQVLLHFGVIDAAVAIRRIDRVISWARSALRDGDEIDYTERIFRIARELTRYLDLKRSGNLADGWAEKVIEHFSERDICCDAHWFSHIYCFLLHHCHTRVLIVGSDSIYRELIVQWLTKDQENSVTKQTLDKRFRSLHSLSELLRVVGLSKEVNPEDVDEELWRVREQLEAFCVQRLEECDGLLSGCVVGCWRDSEAFRSALQDLRTFVEEALFDSIGQIDWVQFEQRMKLMKQLGLRAEPHGCQRVVSEGKDWDMPPILIPELAVYRSMPAYLSRL